jgi:hypothetical protein
MHYARARGEKQRAPGSFNTEGRPAKILIAREFVPKFSVKRRGRCRHGPLKEIAMNREDAQTWLQSSNAIVMETRALIGRCFDELYRLQQAIAEAASAYETSRALIAHAGQPAEEEHAAGSGGLVKQLTEANKVTSDRKAPAGSQCEKLR